MTDIKPVGTVDEPVTTGSNDSLDISIHAKALKQFITISHTSITVGIQREWVVEKFLNYFELYTE